jgi:hypothetical protein
MKQEHIPQDRPEGYQGKHAEVRRKRIISPISRAAMKLFEGRMGKMMTEVSDPADRTFVMHNRTAKELIENDGSKTYVVHSTTPKVAESIIRDGLKMQGKFGEPTVPDMKFTTILLASKDERAATNRNIDDLAYRYGDEHSSIKLVYAFDRPNPGTSMQEDQFADTFMGKADGTNIRQLSSEGEGEYVIPPERLVGYFDLQNEQFVPYHQQQAVAEQQQS